MNDFIEVYVVVEGQTEQTFIRDILAPELALKKIYIHSSLIGQPGHKGENIYFDRAKEDIGKFLKQRQDTFITTMFDYFRIDVNWPGKALVNSTMKSQQKAITIENATSDAVEREFNGLGVSNRFIPYISMYEFEALLFSNPEVLSREASIPASGIKKILQECGEPEEINDGATTAPSKRLLNLSPGYRKVVMGKVISEAIGVQNIREKCFHFNDWIKRLEALMIQ